MTKNPNSIKDTTAYRKLRSGICYALSLLPDHSSPVPSVLIYGQGRSGSTLLESLLCSTGYFSGYGELVASEVSPCWFPVNCIKGCRRLASLRYQKSMVCHVKSWHLEWKRSFQTPEDLLSYCSSPHWLILAIQRENTALQALSLCVARASGRFHRLVDSAPIEKVRIDPDMFIWALDLYEERCARDEVALRDVSCLSVIYEHHLRDAEQHQATIDMILEALGLESRPVEANVIKSVQHPRETVENYEEIDRICRDRGYNDCFE